MFTKDVQSYATNNWSQFLKPISELSKSGDGASLVDSSVELYCFDDICKSLYENKKVPTSADALRVADRMVELVEFKSGFKQRITKNNFDSEKGCCEALGEVCEDFWNKFFELQKANKAELIYIIRLKALESYITLEKQILPLCQDTTADVKLKLIVVIDVDAVDSLEDTLSGLAVKEPPEGNSISDVRKALLRLINLHDAENNTYLYDCIEVLSAQDYLNRLKAKNNKIKSLV